MNSAENTFIPCYKDTQSKN